MSLELVKEMEFNKVSTNRAFDIIEEKLLEGWKLIETACPLSGFPLVEKNGTIYSPMCDMEVVIAPDNSSKQGDFTSRRGLTNLEEESKREVFRLLRMGWRIAKDDNGSTIRCPLSGGIVMEMIEDDSSPEKKKKYYSLKLRKIISGLDAQETSYNEENHEEEEEEEEELQRQHEFVEENDKESTDVDMTTTRMSYPVRREEEWSSEFSKLLLQGWTMLGEHCPVTNMVPLMQVNICTHILDILAI